MVAAVADQRQRMRRVAIPMQPPCPAGEIARLRKDVPARLGAPISERYLDLLGITNGVSTENGTVYASKESRDMESDSAGRNLVIPGLIEENEGLRLDRSGYDRLIVFAESSLYVHAFDMRTSKYIFCVDPARPDEVFDTFDQMMISTLWLGVKPQFRPDPWKEVRPSW
jgi:hypothetical protein